MYIIHSFTHTSTVIDNQLTVNGAFTELQGFWKIKK